MDDAQVNLALQAEYLHLQKTVEDFDARALTIKAWSVTFSMVAIGTAFSTKTALIFLVSAASALLFWMLEAAWKVFQLNYYARLEAIEQHFLGTAPAKAPFQITTTWYAHSRGLPLLEKIKVFFWPHVFVPHVVVTSAGVLLYCAVWSGRICL